MATNYHIKKSNSYVLFCFIVIALFVSNISSSQNMKGKHLFIMSGQSNMQLLRPNQSFIPILQKKYGKKKIITAKYALGTQSIRRWYKKWVAPEGINAVAEPDLYDSLMLRVHQQIKTENIKTITLVWMQGERDAKKGYGSIYEKSLMGLYDQLCNDLGRQDINFINGRLSDFGITKKAWPDWNVIRRIQVEVGESNPRFGWINTDDLNSGRNRKGKLIKDDIHMSAEGYVIMGQRFAEKAIEIIDLNEK